jgi:uncharacterized protein YjiS (DUF1127 family)
VSLKEAVMIFNTHAISATPSISVRAATQGLGQILKRGWDAYWRRRAKRTAVMMLHSLDDHCLHDIGVDRSEIESVIYGKPGDRRLSYERD